MGGWENGQFLATCGWEGPQKHAKITELSMFSSISYCGTLRIAPCKMRFYRNCPCLVGFLLVAHEDLLLGGSHFHGKEHFFLWRIKNCSLAVTKNTRNESPNSEKFQNGSGPGADKFFVWEVGKTDQFWQLVGEPRSGPRKRQSRR